MTKDEIKQSVTMQEILSRGQALYAVRSTEKGLLPARYMRILSIALDAG